MVDLIGPNTVIWCYKSIYYMYIIRVQIYYKVRAEDGIGATFGSDSSVKYW